MSVPTQAEVYMRLLDRIHGCQDDAALLAHLTRSMSSSRKDHALADGWISVSELMKRLAHQITLLAQGKLQ